jgi:archaellum biogenesis ATPase FlaH
MPSAFNAISIKTLLETDVRVEYVVEPLIPVGGAAVIGGDSGLGKSWLVLQLAIAVAAGKPWLGQFQTRQGSVLIVDEEDAIPLIKRRLDKLAPTHAGLALETLPISFAVGQGLNLSDADSVSQLDKTIRECGAQVLILDSLVRVHRASENSASEMSGVFAKLKRLLATHPGLTIVFTHHSRKFNLMNTGDVANNLRGSGDIRAFVDTHLALRKTDQGLVISQEKARWTEAIKPFGIRIADTPGGGVEVIHIGAANMPAVNLVDEFILDALIEGPVTRKNLLEMAAAENTPQRTLDGRLRALVQQKKIQKLRRHPNGETPYALLEEVAESQAV